MKAEILYRGKDIPFTKAAALLPDSQNKTQEKMTPDDKDENAKKTLFTKRKKKGHKGYTLLKGYQMLTHFNKYLKIRKKVRKELRARASK